MQEGQCQSRETHLHAVITLATQVVQTGKFSLNTSMHVSQTGFISTLGCGTSEAAAIWQLSGLAMGPGERAPGGAL